VPELTAGAARARLRAALLALSLALLPPLLSACGGGGGDKAAASRWLVLGSSTAAGSGATPGRSWTARLDATLRGRGAELDNRARVGATTYHALPAGQARAADRPATDPAQDVAVALDSQPRVLILAFPSNDAASGYTAEESTANLLLMRQQARLRGVGVIVLSSQPRDSASAQARAAMLATDASLAAELGDCFVAVRAELDDAQGHIAPAYAAGDGVHLNDAGHGVVFDRLWAAVAAGRCVTPP
jgi:acyl-CoA thioesterase-1